MGEKKRVFYEYLKKEGHNISDKQMQQFDEYARLLCEWNEKMNLTAIVDEEGIFEKHFMDSVMISRKIDVLGTLCDVGSGAGFPSIPLKIIYPELHIVIVEPLRKRCIFLQELLRVLQLDNVEIVNERAEDYAKKNREFFDIVTARAVANLTLLSELCIPFVKQNGLFIAMKGPRGDEEFQEAQYAIHLLGARLLFVDEIHLDGGERKNFVFKKERLTPKQFPRMFSQIKKKPLYKE